MNRDLSHTYFLSLKDHSLQLVFKQDTSLKFSPCACVSYIMLFALALNCVTCKLITFTHPIK